MMTNEWNYDARVLGRASHAGYASHAQILAGQFSRN